MTYCRQYTFFFIVLFLTANCASLPWPLSKPEQPAGELEISAVPEQVLLTDIKSDFTGEAKVVRIKASAPFQYITYMFDNPRRLAVEMEKMSNSLPTSSIMVDDSLIKRISVIDFKEAGSVRVEIWLSRLAKYDLSLDQAELAVSFTPFDEKSDPSLMAERLIESEARIDTLKKEIAGLKDQLSELKHNYNIDENIITDLIEELEKLAKTPETPTVEARAAPEADSTEAESGGKAEESEDKSGEMEISELIGQWRSAWQDRNFESYASFYAGAFMDEDKGIGKRLASKREKFRKAKRITVEIEKLNIAVDDGKAVVEFTQRYSSDRHKDTGVKTLIMIKTGEGWKIESENWRPEP